MKKRIDIFSVKPGNLVFARFRSFSNEVLPPLELAMVVSEPLRAMPPDFPFPTVDVLFDRRGNPERTVTEIFSTSIPGEP